MSPLSRALSADAFPKLRKQRGSFLLEALIAILIVALGVLGSIGLLARSMQDVDDAKFRGEAAYLASALIGEMWLQDRSQAALDAKYGSTGGGEGYVDFVSRVQARLPNGAVPELNVTAGPTTTSSNVTIVISWHLPGDAAEAPDHFHRAMATIGTNQK